MNIDIHVSEPDEKVIKGIKAEIDKITMSFSGFEAHPELVAVIVRELSRRLAKHTSVQGKIPEA